MKSNRPGAHALWVWLILFVCSVCILATSGRKVRPRMTEKIEKPPVSDVVEATNDVAEATIPDPKAEHERFVSMLMLGLKRLSRGETDRWEMQQRLRDGVFDATYQPLIDAIGVEDGGRPNVPLPSEADKLEKEATMRRQGYFRQVDSSGHVQYWPAGSVVFVDRNGLTVVIPPIGRRK